MPHPETHPVFFVHIMKTAGTSVSQSLRAHFPPQRCYPLGEAVDKLGQKVNANRLLQASAEGGPPDLISAHMPAWTAFDVAPGHHHITLLREPLARTVSHLRQIARATGAPSLEAVYEDARWRERLSNYQTRILTLTKAQFEARQARVRADMQREQLAVEDLKGREDSAAMLQYSMLTAMDFVEPLPASAVDDALRQLARFTVVGMTEELQAFTAKLSALLKVELGAPAQLNVTPPSAAVPPELLARLCADNELDIELYRRLRTA